MGVMPTVITNLLNSEKGVMGLALLVGVTVLAGLGRVTSEDWLSYTQWIFGIYVGGKSIQGAAAVFASRPAATAPIASSTTTVVTPPAQGDV